jgi:hypothetical protein
MFDCHDRFGSNVALVFLSLNPYFGNKRHKNLPRR